MSVDDSLHRRITDAAALATEATRGSPMEERAALLAQRLSGPFRLAIAGRAKAGKSTLLNALVGERLAPTDASECTRVVSWYQYGIRYDVHAILRDGARVGLPFTRDNGELRVSLAIPEDDVARLEISWPASRLRGLTLIDTPGLESIDDSSAARTRDLLVGTDHTAGEADAVVYLMRHLHQRDAEFLEAFVDRSLADASPVNAIAVLSRADEIGVARLDALESASRIARRYASSDVLRGLVATVIPVAGLLAETARTLREAEASALREIASLDATALDDMLLSVDRFEASTATSVSTTDRRALLRRFGLFGVRFVADQARRGAAGTASDLSRDLEAASQLAALTALLDGHFMARARALQARTALATLRSIAHELDADGRSSGPPLLRVVDEIEASSHELAELRLVHLLMAGVLSLETDERLELERLTTPGASAPRLGLPAEARSEVIRAAALAATDRWRARGAHPLRDRLSAEACDIAARLCEGIHEMTQA